MYRYGHRLRLGAFLVRGEHPCIDGVSYQAKSEARIRRFPTRYLLDAAVGWHVENGGHMAGQGRGIEQAVNYLAISENFRRYSVTIWVGT